MQRFAPVAVDQLPRVGGGFVLRSSAVAPEHARCLGDELVRWAAATPQRTFLAERAGDDWRRVSYAEALRIVRSLAQGLLDCGLSATRPLAILSGNSIDHALLALAAMHVGIPVAPLSPAYSLASRDHARLRALIEVLAPGGIYAESVAFEPAIAAVGGNVPVLDVAALAKGAPTAAVDRAFAGVHGDTIAKVLFTSGSTGMPRGVVNTQRMLCSNQAALACGWPFLRARPPVIVDWLPWSHTFGANHNFNLILTHGGTLYIDGGKPAPGAFDETVRNLREIPSTIHFNVPRGFDMLVGQLETDPALRATFFRELDVMFYAAAALSPATWSRLEAVARDEGADVAMVSAWGSTETSPLVTQVHFPIARAGVIGVPIPGVELAFVPSGDKLEMRVRGPNVTPGTWRAGGGVDAIPLDELGFYAMGDAGKLDDDAAPERGVVFDGRTSENFKLTSGTWVHVGELRIALVAACSPRIADAVITGHDRDEICALVVPAPGQTVDAHYRDELARALGRLNETRNSSSTRIARLLVLDEPPTIDAGEITDKGYVNQRTMLTRRAALVDQLYTPRSSDSSDPDLILPARALASDA